jgi:hypothetical protein
MKNLATFFNRNGIARGSDRRILILLGIRGYYDIEDCFHILFLFRDTATRPAQIEQ